MGVHLGMFTMEVYGSYSVNVNPAVIPGQGILCPILNHAWLTLMHCSGIMGYAWSCVCVRETISGCLHG